MERPVEKKKFKEEARIQDEVLEQCRSTAKKLKSKRVLKGMMQNVVITLSDGSNHVFTGKAFSNVWGETRTVVKVRFTEPMPLPPGYSFEEVK